MADSIVDSEYYHYAMTATESLGGFASLIPMMTKAIGFLRYFFCIYITYRDGKGTFLLGMYLFYLRYDSTFSYIMASEASKYDCHSWVTSKAVGPAIWSFLELYCIYWAALPGVYTKCLPLTSVLHYCYHIHLSVQSRSLVTLDTFH